MTLRLGFIGAGWIAALHLEALARLGRTELVGVVSRTIEGAAALTGRWGGTPYADLDRMLDESRLDVAYVCVPPFRAVAIGERLVERGIRDASSRPTPTRSGRTGSLGPWSRRRAQPAETGSRGRRLSKSTCARFRGRVLRSG